MTKFYHGSPKPLKAGKKISLRSSSFVLSDKLSIRATESILEASRLRVAPQALSRKSSVFVIDTPDLFPIWRAGGHIASVHEVEPVGQPERSHTGWWTLVNLHWDESGFEALVGQWADAYWLGEECSPDHPLVDGRKHTPYSFPGSWEHRCPAFKVTACLGPASETLGTAVVRHDGSRAIYLIVPDCQEAQDCFGKPSFRGDGTITYAKPDLSGNLADISWRIEAFLTPLSDILVDTQAGKTQGTEGDICDSAQ